VDVWDRALVHGPESQTRRARLAACAAEAPQRRLPLKGVPANDAKAAFCDCNRPKERLRTRARVAKFQLPNTPTWQPMEVRMNNGGGDVRESELRTWRQEIRRMLSTGQRLSAVDDRLDKAALSETERFVLQAIARAQAKHSPEVDSYRKGFGFIDG
jgi:hypothetical protein